MIRKFLGTAKVSIKEMIAYKFEVLMWVILTPITLAVFYFLWRAIYAYTGQEIIGNYAFAELMSYFVLNGIIGGLIWTDVDSVIGSKVRHGTLVINLIRPMDFTIYRLFRKIGRLFFTVPTTMLVITIIGIIFFNLRIVSVLFLILFLISIILAMLLMYYFSFFFGISAFWLKKYSGIRMIKDGISWFAGGGIVPITFFPLIWQKVFFFLPFQYIFFVPIQIFLGKYAILEAIKLIGIQLIWIAVLLVLIKLAWKKGMLQFSAVGG